MAKPTIQLPPPSPGQPAITYNNDKNLVIVGANGTGKSRLGAWIEQNGPQAQLIHRISAQRALNVPDSVTPKTIDSSLNDLLYGNPDSRYASNQYKIGHRWGGKPTTMLQNDYEKVLSVLFARSNQRDHDYVVATRQSALAGNNQKLEIPEAPIELFERLWIDVMPQREIVFGDGKVSAKLLNGPDYRADEMSDGEKVAFYLLAQCICLPKDAVVIIDEPEVHLHRSIMKRLWDAIEHTRADCLFIYITHDLDFAASRVGSFKLWVKQFDGANQWIWEESPIIDGFPEALKLELLGSRKPILFVEGESGSLDELIYSVVYPDWFIVPRGGCAKIIESVRGLRANPALHSLHIAGIIDRDYRSGHELAALAADNVHGLAVAEIESLLCIEEFVRAVSESLARNPETDIASAKDFIIAEFQKELTGQVAKMTAAEVHFRLGMFDRNQASLGDIKNAMNATTTAVDVDGIHATFLKRANEAISLKDYAAVLRGYNRKGLHKQIGSQIFNLNNTGYHDLILRLLHSDKRAAMVIGLRRFCPTLV